MGLVRRKIRKLLKQASGNFSHLKTTVQLRKAWYGNHGAGFYVCPDLLSSESVIYSFGVGEDISFDLDIIRNHGCQVFAFDPTPRVAEWLASHDATPDGFHFSEFGIGRSDETLEFFLPKNPEHVSGSFVQQANVSTNRKIYGKVKAFDSICTGLNHSRIDVLKMDVEGTEYDVLEGILSSDVCVKQLLVEFHDRFFADGRCRTKDAIATLHRNGFDLFAISDSFEELSFVNRAID